MPLFISDEELLQSDPSSVAAKAEEIIIDIRRQLDTVRAEADAASIASDQTYNVLEQRYASLSAEFASAQAECARLSAAAEQRLAEIAEAHAAKHELHLKSIAKDGEIERLKVELSELHKSNRQLLELISKKDTELGEKNGLVQSYFDKIVKLTENANEKESRLQEVEAEVNRCRATCARVLQEKELVEKHNNWLNEELTERVDSLLDLRRTHMDFEADMVAKVAEADRRFNECSGLLKQSEERVRENAIKLATLEEELTSCKDAAASAERQYSAELSTVSKLVELYKESAEAWSGKARDLEGVIKALETHLGQVETDYKSKVEEDTSIIKVLEKDIQVQKEKLDKCEIELENTRKASEKNLFLGFSVHDDVPMAEVGCSEVTGIGSQHENSVLDVLRKPVGISGTALAASLLRDGWSLAKMYEKYQEVADALRHEKWERKNAEAILERVFHEIEQKAEVILEERVEHEKMAETYNLVNQKLLQAQLEHDAYEASIRNLKAELKRCERDHSIVQKENIDLQRQVAVLFKECRDIQVRCGRAPSEPMSAYSAENAGGIDLEQLTFKDIIDLVQQNSQLRGLVQTLSSTEQAQISEMKENFQLELQKLETEASLRVEAVLKRCEEQGLMIESLHNSVAMYKKLYEEEHKVHKSGSVLAEAVSDVGGNKNLLLLFEDSQELAKKAHEEVAMRTRSLEQDLSNLRNELLAMQLERDKFAMEAKRAREKLDGLMMEFDRQKNEANEVSSRNVELSHLVIEHQRKLRESADSLLASEERCKKLSVEVSVLKNEKELFSNSEKRASDEIRNLTERVYRLQSNLDTIQGVEEVREESRLRERRKLEEYAQQIEKDWAQAKKELQEQRDHFRVVETERDRVIEDSVKQVNEMRKELSDALHELSSAEARAVIAEERCTNLEASMKTVKITLSGQRNIGSSLILNEECGNEWNAREEMEKVKEEADANRSYMLQYKEIAHTNEIALKQMESAHEEFKREAEKLRGSLESEILTLRERVAELGFECMSKANEAFSAIVTKEEALSAAALEVQHLKEENSAHLAKVFELESQILSLKDNLEREHERWRSSQNNYERQVVLQSETIQELTKTSQALASLQDEVSMLRSQSDTLKSENELLKASWQAERSSLLKSKEDTERNFKKMDEQNNILHKQLESLHVKYTMKELSSTGQISSVDKSSENDIQNVMSYLRRAKEIAETEITLLRQEKLRLQSQLDMALKSSERAQALLHSERENAKAHLYSDEEFSSLKLQVREINLLRESNAELRAENKHNFEECQRLHEIVQNAKVEAEQLARDRDISTQGYEKEIEVLKIAKMKLESELTELNSKYMSFDIAEFKHVKDELQLTAVKLVETESETSLLKKLLAEKQEILNISEKKLAKCQRELDEQQKIISQEETKVEQLLKEKEDVVRENQLLHKKLEESLAVNKIISGSASEVPIKEIEKDTRIQMLEKTVERLRDYLRKEKEESKREKALRMKNEKLLITRAHMSHQEKRKLEDEMRTLKLHIHNNLNCGIVASQLPNESDLEERSVTYFSSVDKYDEVANRVHGDSYVDLSLPTDSTASDVTISIPDNQVPSKQETHVIQPVDSREKGPVKMNVDGRKIGRKLNRPRLKQSEETVIDVELSEMEGSTTCTEGKLVDSREEESCAAIPSSRKRSSSLSVLESKEDYVRREPGSEAAPLLKKIKESESPPRVAELQVSSELGQSSNSFPSVEEIPIDSAGHDELITDEKLNDADAGLKEEPGELKDVVALEMDSNLESDLIPKFLDKSSEGIRLLDNAMKGNEAIESFLPVLAEEMEEGEMVPDELELQPYEGESLQSQPAAGEAGVADTDGGLEVAVANEANNVVDEVIITEPGKTIQEQSISDKEEAQATPAEHDPADIQVDTTSAPEQGSPGMVTEGVKQTSESEATRTSARIVITERARQNAQLRQAGMATRAQARASARGGLRRDAGRGRGGRGTNLGDKEQQGS